MLNAELSQLVAQWSKAMHLRAIGVTTVPGLNPDCIISGCDWSPIERHAIGPASSGFGRGRPNLFLTDLPS